MLTKKFKTAVLLVMLLVLTIPVAVSASAEKTVDGQIVGLNYATQGHQYSTQMMLVHAQFEPDFVLLISPQKHYMLPNLPRDVKVKYLGEVVRTKGKIDAKGTSIIVNELEVKKGNTYQVVWSQKLQKQTMYDLYQVE
ncbi:MAG: hypothetical protein JRJ12_13985 [Deltaproteobacteria bacterium]|nr:hypothetical protein [Deltaproteobacteria bacterium]MBW2072196.1 hypothetical protein [Deltaproteobacteria bacterium]